MSTHRLAAQAMAADCLCFRARRTSRIITRLYDEALRPLGFQATQLTLLNAVALTGGVMRRIADVLAMDATTLSRNLKPLERAGVIEIARSAHDGRLRVARLTPAGERVLEDALPLWKAAHARVVEVLGPGVADELRHCFDAAVCAASARPITDGS